MTRTKEYRQELAEIFIHALEEKTLDWKKEWQGSGACPINAKSSAKYRGINRFRLMLVSIQRGYEDPRWATFNQIKQMGYQLKNAKGQGVQVEYWFPYDRKERHKITWEEFHELAQGVPGERYMLIPIYSTVFNGDLIEGLPELSLTQNFDVEVDEVVNTLSRKMNVEIINDGGDRAFYRLNEDKIHLPKPEFFYSEYAYNSTALHELAHSTGAGHRLNRDMSGFFGSEKYAYEELIAEITSCFMSEYLAIEQDENHINNHKAYVQSWIQAIKEKPEQLVKAIAEAEKAAAYMEFKAGLIPEKDYEKVINSTKEVEESHVVPDREPVSNMAPKPKKQEIRGPKL